MRRVVLATLLLAAANAATAQGASHEYRPEIVLTLPRVHGYGLQILAEQHLETSDLTPNERTQGIGLVTPTFYAPINARFAMEVRQVITPAVTEHRYIPTMLSTIPLSGGFEIRSRTRAEIRNINQDYSVRWQDRSAVGRDVDILGAPVWTYAHLDLSSDSRFNTLNRTEEQVGARVPVTSGSSVDLYYMRQADTRRAIRVIYASGAIFRIAL